jgi:hypothetical protein
MSCNVCCNTATNFVTCTNCGDAACLNCTKTFIFSGLRKHACCMFCNHAFTKELLFEFFPSSWMKKYKEYQRKFAIDREEALLPGTIGLAAVIKKKKENDAELKEKSAIYKSLRNVFAVSDTSQMQITANDANNILHNHRIWGIEYIAEGGVTPVDNTIFAETMKDVNIVKNFLYILAKIINKNENLPKNKKMRSTHTIDKYATFLRARKCYEVHIDHADNRAIYNRILEIIKTIIVIMSSGFYVNGNDYNFITFKNYKIAKCAECELCGGPICAVTKKLKTLQKGALITRTFCIACGYHPCEECGGYNHINKCIKDPVTHANYKKKYKLYKQLKENVAELKNKKMELYDETNDALEQFDGSEKKKNKERGTPAQVIIHHCHNCNGYVTEQSNGECILCNKMHCEKCQELSHDDACDPEIVKNVKEIKSNTKPCPKCHVRVFKIEGCYQMFCVMCGTPFDWGSGKLIENETIHNPHYAEYLRSLGKNRKIDTCCEGQIENCIRLISEFYHPGYPYHKFTSTDSDYYVTKNSDRSFEYKEYTIPSGQNKYIAKSSKKHRNPIKSGKCYPRAYLQSIYSLCGEIEKEIRNTPNYEKQFALLRVDYLLNEISKEQFHKKIGLMELQREKTESVNIIYRGFIAIMHDYFRTIHANNYWQYINEMIKIHHMTCDAIVKLANCLQLAIELPTLYERL